MRLRRAARKIRAPGPPSCPTDDSSPPRTRDVVHNVCDSFRSRAYTCTTGVELNRIERHSNQTANKGLRHNVLRRYRIEANRATYEYRCTAGELADVPAIPQAVLRAEGRGVADVSGAIGLVRRVDHRPDIQQRDAPLV